MKDQVIPRRGDPALDIQWVTLVRSDNEIAFAR